MEVFEACSLINDLLQVEMDFEARNELIKLLDFHKKGGLRYSPLVNHLIREAGLYPYLETDTASWDDRFAYESFKVDIGEDEPVTLHSEQSLVLRCLLAGEDLAVSAPTSFGKSLIIDAFIAIKKPVNVVILVPTIALTDETRRRLSKKFYSDYKIVTTTDVELGERNIFIFPQERAIHYCDKIEKLDLLVVDEFYKASKEFDKERSPTLLKAMLKLGAIASQRYYLAPNIAKLSENPFTKGMRFLPLDFNTVFLEKHELYKEIKKNDVKKGEALINILENRKAKSLIYAGSYPNVDRVSNLLLERTHEIKSELLGEFSDWLAKNYDPNWKLTSLVKRGTGIHTGQLHRSLSQIQVRLFEEKDGLHNIVSTSSIIEGVNTSAENVIVWSNKNGNLLLNDFTYRNIIGRGGRMFRHFVGNIYILEEPPKLSEIQLDLAFQDDHLADVDEAKFKHELTSEQVARIILYKEEMSNLLGKEAVDRILSGNALVTSDMGLIREIATDIQTYQKQWRGLASLHSTDPEDWGWILYKILKLCPGDWDVQYTQFVEFVKILAKNWEQPIPELLDRIDTLGLGIENFFKLEKNTTYKLAALLNDVNIIQKEILIDKGIDISPFIVRLSRAFLPSCVFELEEYGLPRMISKKIHSTGLINFQDEDLKLHDAIDKLNAIRKEIPEKAKDLDSFDRYVLDYFFEGISRNG